MKKITFLAMKYIIGMALLMILSGNLFAVSKNLCLSDAVQTNNLFVSRTSIMLPSTNACTDTFAITSDVNWTISITETANSASLPTWLTVTPVSGSNNMIVNLAATANATNVIRTALVKVNYGTLVKTIEVKQPAGVVATNYLNVSRTSIMLPSANACTDTFKINSNLNWNITVTGAANSTATPTWLTVTPIAGSNNLIINMSATANTTSALRGVLVKVSSGTLVKTIEVKQPAGVVATNYLNVSRTSIMLPSANACTDTFKINSNVNWNITVTGAANSTATPTWLTVSPIAGSNNLIINMSATANTTSALRGVLVKVSSGTLVKTIEVKQPAGVVATNYLNVSRTSIMLPSANACTDTFKVNSNVNWNVGVFPIVSTGNPIGWLTVTPVAGSNNLIVHLNALANTTNAIRTALVKVTSGTLIKTIEVKQPATAITLPFLNVNPGLFQFDATPIVSKSFNINSNAAWIITTDVNWLTFSATNGNNNAVITVTAAPNTTAQMRMGWIIVSIPGSLSKFIQVKQAGTATSPIQQQLNQNSNAAEKSINTFPNPATDYITVFSDQDFANNDFVEVFSMDGKVVLKQSLTGNNVRLDLQNLKKGIYFLKINQNNDLIIKTITKN